MRWRAKKYAHKEGDKEIVTCFAWTPKEGPDGTVYWLEKVRIQRTWEWLDISYSNADRSYWYANEVVLGPATTERA